MFGLVKECVNKKNRIGVSISVNIGLWIEGLFNCVIVKMLYVCVS